MDRGALVRSVLFGTVLLLGLLIGYPTPALEDSSEVFLPVVQHQPIAADGRRAVPRSDLPFP